MNGKEKRQHPRIVSRNLVSYVCLDGGGRLIRHGMGRTLDVNQQGILLETFAEIASDCTLSLAIGLKDETILISGHVVHQKRSEDGRCQSGIAFVQMDEKTLAALNRFIAEFQAEACPVTTGMET